MHRAFASMDDQELNRVSETLNTEMDQRQGAQSEGPRNLSQSSGGDAAEAAANEPGSRARSRSKAVTRRRAQRQNLGNIPVTTATKIFPKVLQYKGGGVLRYKWEAY